MHAENNLKEKLKKVYYHSFLSHLLPKSFIVIFFGELS